MGFGIGMLMFTGVSAVIIYVIRKLLSHHWGWSDRSEEEDVRGRTIIITGASRGIGRETAVQLADRHARVIVTARTLELAREVVVDIRKRTFFGEVIPMKLDLGSIRSIKEFYHEIIKRYDTIDILINNAGVLTSSDKLERTDDGFEIHFGGWCFKLRRIVIVSSGTYQTAKLDFGDLNWETRSEGFRSTKVGDYPLYKSSKLANILFANELSKRLEGTGVHVYTVCPGNVMTSIGRHLRLPLHFYIFYFPFVLLTIKTVLQGCQTILYCALSKKCANETGLMYRNCDLWTTNKFYFPDDIIMPKSPKAKAMLNEINALRLWDESEKYLQMKFPVT